MKLTFDLGTPGYPWELVIESEGGGSLRFRGVDLPEVPGVTTETEAAAVDEAEAPPPPKFKRIGSRGAPPKYDPKLMARAVQLALEVGVPRAIDSVGLPSYARAAVASALGRWRRKQAAP